VNRLNPAIWVVGSTMIDMITYAERLPERGETLVGQLFSLGFGGKGANQAVMARRLGARVAMVNCLGADAFGEMTLDNFRREGIDVQHVATTTAASSGVAPIWVEADGANRIIVVPGANLHMSPDGAARAIVEAATVDVVLGQLEIDQVVTASAFAAAHGRGALTVLNVAPAAPLRQDLIAETDWLIANEIELADLAASLDLAPELDAVAGALGVRMVVTLGERGAELLAAGGARIRVPARRVQAVDTTGAGDAFVGAFTYALAAGLSDEVATRLGCDCATASVQRPGTQSSFPTAVELSADLGVSATWGS
jgi:ribokinase